ncbi:hypothetical protein F0562_024460 [Nyssa sinensis]|uniref:alpha-mannosidase n=1 Tax=Nyssa sinensis TaxID=561372 RepID=A0A5J5BHN0_9ASTE|nr:hypothetical protein F0562_024460 [Nyssa sinensis]
MVYNTSQSIVPGKLNVHLVAHTHDDVGWLKTVDQYYIGSNNTIQAFFQRWWRQQSEAVQNRVKKLVSSGQLEFINGGMCMHDEAAPHYIDMIDQTTLGHRFVKEEFNVTPRIGWQIDPFGHSAVQAYLLGAEVGFDSLFFGRIDYQDKAKRKNEKSLEVIWQGSKTLGSSAQIFACAFPRNYEPPTGFDFEVDDYSPIVQDDINLFDYNVQERVDDFVAAALSQDGRVNALYSTPTIYTDAKYAANESWPLKTDDFFPYADRVNAYWTGYFTSRPALKGYVRMMSGYYLAARQLEFFNGRSKTGPTTDSLADALAIAQHHDAVSGTEKQHVADDYAKRLSIGYKEVISDNVTVQDSSGKEIESQLLPLVNASVSIRNYYATAHVGKSPSSTPKYWLAFTVSVPPLGFSTYVLSSAKGAAATLVRQTLYESTGSQNDAIEVGPGNLKLIYSGNGGKLSQYVNKRNLVNASVEQSYSYYSGYDGSQDLQYFQITRVYKEKEHAEVEFAVGPIPIDDGIGKEIVTQITTAMKSNKTFYTDSNGRDFITRIRDYRADWDLEVSQPVAGNYYPINLGIYMKDDSTELSILVDRSVGGSSIVDGQLELMLHRGVAEALNETVCILDECTGLTIQGKYYLRIDPLREGAKWRRSFGQEIYSPFLLAFSEQDGDKWSNFKVSTFSGMDPSYSLPDNVAMITLQELEDGKVLLRLAHLYEIAEDKDLSVVASVELKKVFPTNKINKITEMSLSANQEREEMEKKRLTWKVESSQDEEPKALRGRPVDPAMLVVELAPMEIRTFIIDFSYKWSTTERKVA